MGSQLDNHGVDLALDIARLTPVEALVKLDAWKRTLEE